MKTMKTTFVRLLLAVVLAAGVTSAAVAQPSATLSGNITGLRQLSADTVYNVQGFVNIQPGATLKIPAGTKLVGVTTTDCTAVAVIQTIRGDVDGSGIRVPATPPSGVLIAEGTKTNPIVFTSPAADGAKEKKQIGGIWLNGNAPNNAPGGTRVGEGNADNGGGNVPDDSSGVLRYVRVEFGGSIIAAGSEINGVTFNGVGSRTVVDYVQVHVNADDGFEFFGGTVNAKHLVATGIEDDNLDTDNSFIGKIQHVVIAQDNVLGGNRGYESDNDGGTGTSRTALANGGADLLTRPTIYNVTAIGSGFNLSGSDGNASDGMYLRRNTSMIARNQIFSNWGRLGLVLDGRNTIDNFNATSGDSVITVENSIFWVKGRTGGVLGNAVYADTTTGSTGSTDLDRAKLAAAGNTVENPSFRSVNYAATIQDSVPDLRLATPKVGATPPNDGFFDQVNYIGAFGATDWLAGWTNWSQDASKASPSSATLGVRDETYSPSAKSFELKGNYPNPFNPSTTIQYSLATSQVVTLKVYDMLGREVETLVGGERKAAGTYSLNFDASKFTSGVYFYRLTAGTFSETKKMMLVK